MTIYDIAEMAGVSASSVSRVINGKPGVNRKKRAEIEALLHEHHYMPDENARNLVLQENHTVGILTDNLNEDVRMSDGLVRAEYELLRNGYYCFVKYIGKGSNAIEEGVKDLARHRVQGALLMGVSFRNTKELKRVLERYLPDTPVCFANQKSDDLGSNVYMVNTDGRDGFERCVALMVRKKRKHLALMIDKGRPSLEIIRTGFMDGLRKAPGLTGIVYTNIPATIEGGEKAVIRLLAEHPEVDGLLCASDMVAIGALNELQGRGIRVPEQIAILGEDNSPYCEVCRPKLSSMDTMLPTAVLTCTRTLIDVLNGVVASHYTSLQMQIVERMTT